jgi:hypothetical protein
MSCSHETEEAHAPPLPGLRARQSELPALVPMVQVAHILMGAQANVAAAVDYAAYQAEARWIWAEMYVMVGNLERARALRKQAKWILAQFQAQRSSTRGRAPAQTRSDDGPLSSAVR